MAIISKYLLDIKQIFKIKFKYLLHILCTLDLKKLFYIYIVVFHSSLGNFEMKFYIMTFAVCYEFKNKHYSILYLTEGRNSPSIIY